MATMFKRDGYYYINYSINGKRVRKSLGKTKEDAEIYLKEIESKHTLLISDACFAGSILKTRNAFPDYDLAIGSLYELPSRKAMTSGTLTEVPDQSVFLKYLVDRLQNNFEKYLSSEQLFSKIRLAVINNSKVLPQYGVIQEVGDEGGDFIFIQRE